jgi:hypothetical protein
MANVELSGNSMCDVSVKEMKDGQIGVITNSTGTLGNHAGRVVMKIHKDMLVLLDNGDFWYDASQNSWMRVRILGKNEKVVLTNSN